MTRYTWHRRLTCRLIGHDPRTTPPFSKGRRYCHRCWITL